MATLNPLTWSASVLTSLTSDTEPTIVFTFDNAKYIFNAGENTNRAFLQSQYNWKRTQALFFTQLSTQRCAGLAGLLMTFADATIKNLDIVGPKGLTHYLGSMRSYTFRETMAVTPKEIDGSIEPVYKDQFVTVYGIPIVPTPPPSMEVDASLKRKRSPSPDSPSKKLATEAGPIPVTEKSLTELMDNDDSFVPSDLKGQVADDWRRLIVRTMFPYAGPKPRPKNEKELYEWRKQQGLEKEVQAGDARARHLPRPQISHFFERMPSLPKEISEANSSPNTRPSVAYIVVGPRLRGKFNVQKAEELGVPFGFQRARLTSGETITFTVTEKDENGEEKTFERTVKPQDVLPPPEEPSVAVIIDVPTPAHIQSIISSFDNIDFYKKYRSDRSGVHHITRSVFHILGEGVLEDERYVEWMHGWGDVQHHVSCPSFIPDPVTFTSSAYNLLRLSQLDPQVFTVPKYSLWPKKDIKGIPNIPPKTYLLLSPQTVDIRPSSPPVSHKSNDIFHPAVTSDKSVTIEGSTWKRFREAKAKVKAMRSTKQKSPSNSPQPDAGAEKAATPTDATVVTPEESEAAQEEEGGLPGKDVVIYPLGTGSALPTKYRNVSSILIKIPNYGYILLDCGEGTFGQLMRQFGTAKPPCSPRKDGKEHPPNVWDVLRNIKAIYLSHIHGDHHMGVAHLLAKRKQLDPPPEHPLYLITLYSIHVYLREVNEIEDLGFDDEPGNTSRNGVVTIMSEALHWKQMEYRTYGRWRVHGNDEREPWRDIKLSREREKALCEILGLESFKTVDVRHQTKCYGAVVKHKDGWSVVFSADTQPADNLVYAGQGATLLIHEATMADDQVEMAEKKAHSTVGQALAISKRMNASILLLTHFSARYPKMPPTLSSDIQPGSQGNKAVVALAFDNAVLKMGDMWKLGCYYEALEMNFAATKEEGDDEKDGAVAGVFEVNIG